MKRAVALALVASCTSVTAGEQDQAIVGGAPADDEAVVAIVERPRCSEQFTVTCTGTVIAPQVVLTAAHCIVPGAPREVHVGSPVGAGTFVAVTDVVRHPAFDDATHAFDLGIVYLAEPVAVAPVALPSATLDATYVGASARIVGFGVEAPGATSDGVRRAGTMQIESVDVHTFAATPAPNNTCGGDSGGPVFVDDQLLGITVAGDPTCAVRAIDGRVDISVADFIEPNAAAPPPPPPPDSGPPCPGAPGDDDGCAASRATTGYLALALALALALRRRGRTSRRRTPAGSTR